MIDGIESSVPIGLALVMGGMTREQAFELMDAFKNEILAALDHPEPEVTEDSCAWSVEILNKPSGKWAKMMGASMHCDTEDSASAYAYRLVDKCGVPSARVVQTRTISTVEEVYPA